VDEVLTKLNMKRVAGWTRQGLPTSQPNVRIFLNSALFKVEQKPLH
jgi:hypothetical protein